MPVARNVPQLSATLPTVRYLTRRGDTWRFQVRVPSNLKKYLRIQHFRCSIGCMRIREADLKAKVLVVAVESVLSKVRAMAMQLELELGGADGAADPDMMNGAAFDLTTMAMVEWTGVMRGLGLALDMSPIAPPVADPYLDGLKRIVQLNAEFKHGPIKSPYLLEHSNILMREAISSMSGNAAAPPFEKLQAGELLASMERLTKAVEGQVTQWSPTQSQPNAERNPGTLFSKAAEEYVKARIDANGGKETGDVHSIRSRTALFIELVGDRPISEYGPGDLQTFVNQLQYWPPIREGNPAFAGKGASEIIALNKRHTHGVLALNTLKGHYLNDVKTAVGLAAANGKIPDPFKGAKLIYPKIFALPKRRRAPDPSKLVSAFELALESQQLHKVMMMPLGFFTGRRLGLLTSLRGDNIRRVGSFVVAQLDQHRRSEDGALEVNGFKTSESLDGFILHDFFDKIGFVDWAMAWKGPIFPKTLKWVDPEDAMQKAVNLVLRNAQTGGSYHGLRGLCITAMRNASVTEYSNRVQSGHAAIDEHEEYGDLPVKPEDAPKLANLPYPPGFDIQPFMGLDFDAMARR